VWGLPLTADGGQRLALDHLVGGLVSAVMADPGQAGALNGRAGGKAHRGNISASSRARSRRRLAAGAESVDKGAVLGAEVELGLLVRSVDEWRGATVGGGGRLCGSWARMAATPMGSRPLALFFGLGRGLDLFDDAAAFGLALVFGQVQQQARARA